MGRFADLKSKVSERAEVARSVYCAHVIRLKAESSEKGASAFQAIGVLDDFSHPMCYQLPVNNDHFMHIDTGVLKHAGMAANIRAFLRSIQSPALRFGSVDYGLSTAAYCHFANGLSAEDTLDIVATRDHYFQEQA